MSEVAKSNSVWTFFMDMHSGGDQKLDHSVFWIECDEDRAAEVFMDMFGRDPDNVTCSCCGADYSYWESEFVPENGQVIVSKEDMARFYGGQP